MKRCLILLGILLLIASCDEVIFPEPQPPKVEPLINMPEVLQGTWIDHNGDTLYIRANSYSYFQDLASFKDVFLSDTSVMKFYKDRYFYSTPIYVKDERYWVSYMIAVKEDGSGFDLLGMDPDDIVKLAMLQEITSKIEDIEDGDRQM